MNQIRLYYNPRCGTCRNALDFLEKKGIKPRIVEYLKTPPTLAELKDIADQLGNDWKQMIRTKEPVFSELNLSLEKNRQLDLLQAIGTHPILLQRPIVVHKNQAVVARPAEKIEEIL